MVLQRDVGTKEKYNYFSNGRAMKPTEKNILQQRLVKPLLLVPTFGLVTGKSGNREEPLKLFKANEINHYQKGRNFFIYDRSEDYPAYPKKWPLW